MLIEIQIFKTEYGLFAFVVSQNEETGNYAYQLRAVRGAYGQEIIRWNGTAHPVEREVTRFREEQARQRDMENEVERLRTFAKERKWK